MAHTHTHTHTHTHLYIYIYIYIYNTIMRRALSKSAAAPRASGRDRKIIHKARICARVCTIERTSGRHDASTVYDGNVVTSRASMRDRATPGRFESPLVCTGAPTERRTALVRTHGRRRSCDRSTKEPRSGPG